jgi:hypothetical protein
MSGLPQDIKLLNKKLIEREGRAFNGRPWYRIAWSENQTEKRIGTFNDFHGEIFMRQFRGMREVRKYEGPDFRDRWILEKLIFIDNPEVWGAYHEGSYEPIWVFRGPNGEYQKPNLRSVEFLLGMINSPKETMTQYQVDQEEERSLQAEIASEEDRLHQEASMFDEEATIVVPSNYIGSK